MNDTADVKRSFWRQPLVHFLLAGAVIFALNGLRGTPEPAGSQRIIVTVAQVERMAGLWQKTWGRPPSEAELQALVRDHIKEEVYYREALKLGLDVNDTVIRRRLRQKMEFLTSADAESIEPTDDALNTFYEQNAETYRRSPIFDFEQVYFALENSERAAKALQNLRAGINSADLGDPISLPRTMTRVGEAGISRTFGSEFYRALMTLDPDGWLGPITSGFGQHLVRITQKEPSRLPALADIRATLENDWRAEQRIASLDAVYQVIRADYDVDIEVPEN